MSKAIMGAAMIGAAVGMIALAPYSVGLAALLTSGPGQAILFSIFAGGVSMEAGAIAGALTSNRGTNITTRQAAAYRQIIRGEQRVGGVEIYRNTTGGNHDQFNYIIVLATHVIDSIVNLYLDGRQVYWNSGSAGNTTRNGVNFGGDADHNTHIGPNGLHYNFGTLVYCEARFGDQADGDVMGSLTANDPNWTTSASGKPWVGGCAYVYLKVEYDMSMFPGEPEIRFTVRGKNNILDPRTSTTGYTSNWALHVADHLADPIYGVNDANAINQAQLIAAANVCDQQVALANGQTEARYALHMHYDTSMSPGDVLQQMMPGAMGRISRVGGEWFIWPAYWQGASFAFDQSMLISAPQWSPVRSYRDLINRVTGTYTAPNFPYNVAGNLYDANGWYDGSMDNTFPYAFQPTNYPMYAADTLHGYAADEYLIQDGNVPLPVELALPNVLSIAQAQRCAKIHLMRNRYQGTATFTMALAAWQMQPTDVMNFTFPALTFENKIFEIDSVQLKVEQQQTDSTSESEDSTALSIFVVISAITTDPSVYAWSVVEELNAYDVPGKLTQGPYAVAVPPNVTVESSAGTAITNVDGVITPRALVSWGIPLDKFVSQIQIQYQPVTSPASGWIDSSTGLVSVSLLQAFVSGVIAGNVYNFRVRSVRSTGAVSDWVEEDGLTISLTLSNFANTGVQAVAPASALSSQSLAPGTAQIIVYPFTAIYGSLGASCLPSGEVIILNLLPSQLYFVYYFDPYFSGGAISPIATQNMADFEGKAGYWLINSIVTAHDSSGGGAGRFAPTVYSDSGTSTTTNPEAAYDQDVNSYAIVHGGGGNCIWRGFANVTPNVNLTLTVDAQLTGSPCNISALVGTFQSMTSTAGARQKYTLPVPANTNLNSIYVQANSSGTSSGVTVLQWPTTLLNGWGPNAHEGAYEMGEDQGYNWGLNNAVTPGYNTPASAYDGNLATSSNISFQHTHQYAGCVWTFAALSGGPPSALWLNINSMVNPYTMTGRSAGIWYSLDGGTTWVQIYNTPTHGTMWNCIQLSPTQDCSKLQVMAFLDAHDDMAHYVYAIQLATGPQSNTPASSITIDVFDIYIQ